MYTKRVVGKADIVYHECMKASTTIGDRETKRKAFNLTSHWHMGQHNGAVFVAKGR